MALRLVVVVVRSVVEHNREQLPVDDGRREPSEAGRRGGGALVFWDFLLVGLFV